MTAAAQSARMDATALKIEAARAALGHVERRHAARHRQRHDGRGVRQAAGRAGRAAGSTVIGVPTSERTAALCRKLGVPLSSLDETPELDLTIDGADEVDPRPDADQGRRRRAAAREDRRGGLAAHDRHRRPLKLVDDARRASRCRSRSTASASRRPELAIGRAAAGLGLSGPLTLRTARRRAFRYRRRTFHHRCIFWPHSRSKSAVGCAPRNSGGCGARPVPRHGVRRDLRRLRTASKHSAMRAR